MTSPHTEHKRSHGTWEKSSLGKNQEDLSWGLFENTGNGKIFVLSSKNLSVYIMLSNTQKVGMKSSAWAFSVKVSNSLKAQQKESLSVQ